METIELYQNGNAIPFVNVTPTIFSGNFNGKRADVITQIDVMVSFSLHGRLPEEFSFKSDGCDETSYEVTFGKQNHIVFQVKDEEFVPRHIERFKTKLMGAFRNVKHKEQIIKTLSANWNKDRRGLEICWDGFEIPKNEREGLEQYFAYITSVNPGGEMLYPLIPNTRFNHYQSWSYVSPKVEKAILGLIEELPSFILTPYARRLAECA